MWTTAEHGRFRENDAGLLFFACQALDQLEAAGGPLVVSGCDRDLITFATHFGSTETVVAEVCPSDDVSLGSQIRGAAVAHADAQINLASNTSSNVALAVRAVDNATMIATVVSPIGAAWRPFDRNVHDPTIHVADVLTWAAERARDGSGPQRRPR